MNLRKFFLVFCLFSICFGPFSYAVTLDEVAVRIQRNFRNKISKRESSLTPRSFLELLAHPSSQVRASTLLSGLRLANSRQDMKEAISGDSHIHLALAQLIGDPDHFVRIYAGRILGIVKTQDPRVSSILFNLIKSDNSAVRYQAGEIIRKLGSRSIMPRAIHELNHTDPNVSFNLFATLVESKVAHPILRDSIVAEGFDLVDFSEYQAVFTTLEAFQKNPEENYYSLRNLLENPNKNIRALAVHALVKNGLSLSSFLADLEVAAEDEEAIVRESARAQSHGFDRESLLSTLSHVQEQTLFTDYQTSSTQPVTPEEIPSLIAALQSANLLVRAEAAEKLGQSRNLEPNIQVALVLSLNHIPDLNSDQYEMPTLAHESIIKVLSRTSIHTKVLCPEAIAELNLLLEHPNASLRSFISEAIGTQLRLNDPLLNRTIARLVNTDQSLLNQENFAGMLGLIGSNDDFIIDSLLSAVTSQPIVESLAEQKPTESCHSNVIHFAQEMHLDACQRLENSQVRMRAAWSLGQIKPTLRKVDLALVGALGDVASSVREEARNAILNIFKETDILGRLQLSIKESEDKPLSDVKITELQNLTRQIRQ